MKFPGLAFSLTLLFLFVNATAGEFDDHPCTDDAKASEIIIISDCDPELIPHDLCKSQDTLDHITGYTQVFFPASDQLSKSGHYEKGTQAGFWKTFYPNGTDKSEGHFTDGVRTGFWKDFYPETGVVASEGHFEACMREGFWVFYHENGKKAADGYYREAVKFGVWQFYDERGKLEQQLDFQCK